MQCRETKHTNGCTLHRQPGFLISAPEPAACFLVYVDCSFFSLIKLRPAWFERLKSNCAQHDLNCAQHDLKDLKSSPSMIFQIIAQHDLNCAQQIIAQQIIAQHDLNCVQHYLKERLWSNCAQHDLKDLKDLKVCCDLVHNSNLNITQHNLYWKMIYNSYFTPTLLFGSSVGNVLQMQPFSLSLNTKIKLQN